MKATHYFIVIIFQILSIGAALYAEENSKDCVVPERVCPNSNITFWIYTKFNSENPTRFDLNNNSTIQPRLSYFNNTIKILIHGFGTNKDDIYFKMLRQGFFNISDCSIIMVDFGPLVKKPCYTTAVNNSELIANCTAQMIDYLVENASIPLTSIHVIAHSLGAQVSGKMANYLSFGKVGRITGLDPALPLFTTDNVTQILDSNDAKLVDIIHTNVLVQGQLKRTGHIDFYVNNGADQPGCDNSSEAGRNDCDHVRSIQLYAESIDSKIPFVGRKCSSWILHQLGLCQILGTNFNLAIMGEYVSQNKTGTYFLKTNSNPPYALGMAGIY